MRYSEVYRTACLLDATHGLSRNEAILRLLVRLSADGHLPVEVVLPIHAAMLAREALGSTAIGHGIACPRSRSPVVCRTTGAVGLVRGRGIEDYESLDGEPVDMIFLLIGVPDRPGDYLLATEWIGRLGKSTDKMQRLRQARSDEELRAILSQVAPEVRELTASPQPASR